MIFEASTLPNEPVPVAIIFPLSLISPDAVISPFIPLVVDPSATFRLPQTFKGEP